MGYKLGHKRETVAKAMPKGQKHITKFAGGKGNMAYCPKLDKSGKK